MELKEIRNITFLENRIRFTNTCFKCHVSKIVGHFPLMMLMICVRAEKISFSYRFSKQEDHSYLEYWCHTIFSPTFLHLAWSHTKLNLVSTKYLLYAESNKLEWNTKGDNSNSSQIDGWTDSKIWQVVREQNFIHTFFLFAIVEVFPKSGKQKGKNKEWKEKKKWLLFSLTSLYSLRDGIFTTEW